MQEITIDGITYNLIPKIQENTVYKQEELQFKVGDYIIFENLPKEYKHRNGDVVKITDIDEAKYDKYWIKHSPESFSGGGFGYNAFKNCIRKATKEEIKSLTKRHVTLSNGKSVFVTIDKIIAEGKEIKYKYIENLYCNTNTFGDTGWTIQYNTFDIGCWKNVTRADLKLILDTYNEINSNN